MRIVSGSMRGTKLYTLDGMDVTRPTLDRVKEALFNILNFKIKDALVLDLFAGSGALGLEAVSRGAKKTYFCDSSFEAVKIINKNIEKTRSQDKTVVIQKDYKKALEKCQNDNLKFDMVFLDPPYKTDYIKNAIDIILDKDLLKEDGIIIIETDIEKEVLKEIQDFSIDVYDVRKYGRVSLIFVRRKG